MTLFSRRIGVPVLVTALGTAACTGIIADGSSEGGPGAGAATGSGSGSGAGMGTGGAGASSGAGMGGRGSVTLECDPKVAPSVAPLRRLSRLQYTNTLRALLDRGALEGVVDAAEPQFAQLPPDGENESVFSGNDARVTQRHVDAFYGITDAVARAISEDEERLTELVGACATEDPLTEDCVSAFVSDFGRKVFRRPLKAAEHDRYLELYDTTQSNAEIFRGIVFQFLMSPPFLYHFEVEGTAGETDPARLTLTPFELASRLSFHFWQTMPDDELLDAAESGELETEDGFNAQVDRLFADPRTQETVRKFWNEWYQLEAFAGFATTPAFTAFSDDVQPNDALHADMVSELHELIDHFTWQTEGSYRDVLTSNLVFTRSSELAALYGVEPRTGDGPPAASFPEGRHAGLLSRAAMLVSGNELTNPIKRGAFVLRSVLCTDLHPPSDLPAEALTLPPADPTQSTRDRFEAKTSPGTCTNCHATFNPFGFVLESFDALGRFRTEERIYDDFGELLSTVPIDPAVELRIGNAATPAASAAELSQALADSPLTSECFARHYFRYTYRRDEALGDSCALAAIRDAGDTEGLRAALRSIALEAAFRQKVVGAP